MPSILSSVLSHDISECPDFVIIKYPELFFTYLIPSVLKTSSGAKRVLFFIPVGTLKLTALPFAFAEFELNESSSSFSPDIFTLSPTAETV